MSLLFSRGMISAFFSLFSIFPICRGALTWERQCIEQTAGFDEKSALAIFHFKNTGTTIETITAVQPGCSCTKVELTKQSYVPNESGEVRATMDFGDHLGIQEKTIDVFTLDGGNTADVLTWRVKIPEKISAEPRMLWWNSDNPTAEITATITAIAPAKINSVTIESARLDGLSARIEIVESGKMYRLVLKSLAGKPPLHTVVSCSIDYANARPSQMTFYVFNR